MSETQHKSGYHYPNRIGRIYLQALAEIMGDHGLKAILRYAKLDHLIDNLPPDNLALEFPFEDYAAINQALEDLYGPRGGRGLALRAGRKSFDQGLKDFGAVVGVADKAFKLLPLHIRLNVGLRAMAKTFTQFSDQVSHVEELPDRYVYIIERCPVCWGRHSDRPICYAAVGLLEAGIEWGTGRRYKVVETQCVAKGDPACSFDIFKEPLE
ncbi:MAG: V4R domain-containing protein [Anaerolineae bacterium]